MALIGTTGFRTAPTFPRPDSAARTSTDAADNGNAGDCTESPAAG